MSETPQETRLDTPQAFRSWAFAAIVIWVVVGAGLVVNSLGKVADTVLPALTSFFIAGLLLAIFRPVTHWLKAHKVNDALAALLGVLSALVAMGVLAMLFLGPVITGAAGFLTSIPTAAANINDKLQAGLANYQKLPPNVKQVIQSSSADITSKLTGFASNGVGMLVSGVSGIFFFGLSMFLALILMFWFLKDGPHIAKSCLKVVPERWQDDVCVIAKSFDQSFSGYLIATAINCSIIFVLDGIGFALIKLPDGWFIAAGVAVLGIIPYLGSILSFLLAVVAGLIVGPELGIATGVIVFAVDQTVYSFIGPIVAGKTVTLHPVMIIFALSIGAALAGFLGAVLSIPIAAAIRVVYIYYRDRARAGAAAGSAEPAAEEA